MPHHERYQVSEISPEDVSQGNWNSAPPTGSCLEGEDAGVRWCLRATRRWSGNWCGRGMSDAAPTELAGVSIPDPVESAGRVSAHSRHSDIPAVSRLPLRAKSTREESSTGRGDFSESTVPPNTTQPPASSTTASPIGTTNFSRPFQTKAGSGSSQKPSGRPDQSATEGDTELAVSCNLHGRTLAITPPTLAERDDELATSGSSMPTSPGSSTPTRHQHGRLSLGTHTTESVIPRG